MHDIVWKNIGGDHQDIFVRGAIKDHSHVMLTSIPGNIFQKLLGDATVKRIVAIMKHPEFILNAAGINQFLFYVENPYPKW